jgi:hypothetical protein
MLLKLLKYFFFLLIGILVVVAIIATPFIMSARSEGEKLYQRYDSYAKQALADNFQLKPFTIKEEYRTLQPWKALRLMKFAIESQEGAPFKRVNTLDASLFLFMRMYTLLITPDYRYNLPMLSADIIFIGGGKRVFVIEIIDPAQIKDDNLETHYSKMRAWEPEIDKLEPMPVNMEWAKDIVTDFSIHARADRTRDEKLFELFKAYLDTYIAMAKNARPVTPEQSKKVADGMKGYVSALIAKGGPAVNVFKQLLGSEKQQEYVRSVMFGVD